MCIRRTLYVHERLNANLHERNTTCVDKVSLKKIMSKQMRILLSRTGPRHPREGASARCCCALLEMLKWRETVRDALK